MQCECSGSSAVPSTHHSTSAPASSPDQTSAPHAWSGSGFCDWCFGPLWQPFLSVPIMPGSPHSQTQHWVDFGRLHNFHFPRAAGIGQVAVRVFWLDGHSRTNFDVLSLFSRKSGLPQLYFLLLVVRPGVLFPYLGRVKPVIATLDSAFSSRPVITVSLARDTLRRVGSHFRYRVVLH